MLLVTALGSVSGGVFWTGVFFVTREHYRFTPTENLVLALVMGTGYAVVAQSAGRISARLARFGQRRIAGVGLALWSLAALTPALVGERVGIWLSALAGAAVPGVIWPVVESFLSGGRHGPELRRVLGPFNLTWTFATALPLLVAPWLTRLHPLGPLLFCATTNACAVLALRLLPKNPAESPPEHAAAHVGREYPALLVSSRWLLPLSYLLLSALSPILPHRLAALALPVPAPLVAATWMIARFATLGVMTALPHWHGRWGVLVAGGAALMAGVALALLGDSLATVVIGLAAFGAGLAVTYFCAIYYSLAVGHGAVEAGGGFEALIGVGYMAGPFVGLCGELLPGEAAGAAGTVGLAWAAALAGAALALRPYLGVRRARREPR